MKFATKSVQQYPLHLRHVATLRWEIKNLKFPQIADIEENAKKCILIASNFASLSPY